MSAKRFLYYYLWIAPHIFLVGIAFLMARRKLVAQFPFFFSYAVFEVLQFPVMFVLDNYSRVTINQYLVSFLVGDAIGMALRFGVIYEVFNHLFQQYPALKGLGSKLLRWTAVVLILVAVGSAAYSSRPGLNAVTQAWLIPGRALSVMQCGLLLLLFVFSKHFGISWRNFVFGLALGLGLWAAGGLALKAVRTELGPDFLAEWFNTIDNGVYHCVVLLWLVYLLVPERVAPRVSAVPAHDMDKWNRELERLLQR